MSGIAPTSNIVPSSYPSQSGSAYPLNIDGNAIAGLRRWGAFAPRVQTTPNMTFAIDPGYLLAGVTLTELGAWTAGNVSSGSNSVTVTGPVSGVSVGQQILAYGYVAGTFTNYFPVGTIVTAVSGATITVNQNATASLSGAILVFSQPVGGVILGNTHSSTTVDGLATTVPAFIGMAVAGTGIPAGTTVSAIPSSSSITLSQAATATASGVSLSFSIPIPVSNPRIDRVVVNATTGAISWVKGTEVASPSAPAIPAGNNPLAQLSLTTSTTAITMTSNVIDERAIDGLGFISFDIHGLASKATPLVADEVPIYDIAGAAPKKSTWTQIIAAIFGTAATVNTGTSGATLGLNNTANTISGVETHTAGVIGAVVPLTDAATVTPDLATGNNFFWLIGGNRTLAVPANPVAGTSFEIDVQQDTTGSRTLTAAWIYTWAGGTAGALSTPGCSFDRLFGTIAYYGTSVITTTIAAPGVVTWTGHGLHTGCRLQLTTTGALPTGLSANTTYFVTKIDANTFKLSTSLANCAAGTFITTTGSQSGVHTAVAGDIGLALNKAFA